MVISIIGRIQKHCQSEKDREELIRLGSWGTRLDYHWKSDVVSALIDGWPQYSKITEICLKALREKKQPRQSIMNMGLALEILLKGYPQDQDVAQFCVDQIKHEEFPFIAIDPFKGWHLLSQNFKDSPELIKAIDEWIGKPEHIQMIAKAALVGRTPKAKAQLLSSCRLSLPYWPTWALLKGWGMKDTEVKEQLTQIAFGDAARASQIATLLPQIIQNDERRQAAFCGLVILDRLDIMVQAKEQNVNNKPCTISLFDHWAISPNIPLLRHILQTWDTIKTAFGDEFWCRFFKDRPNLLRFWNELCLFADDYPSPRQEALRFLEERSERTAPPNILRFLGRTAPKSQLLLEYCLKALSLRDDKRDYSREKVVAAELLGTHFGGDSEVLMQLISSKASFETDVGTSEIKKVRRTEKQKGKRQ